MSKLTLDPRRGSGEFERLLKRLGVPVRLKQIPYGDFTFRGSGPKGEVRVAVERKTINELLEAVTDNRFVGHQLPGLLSSIDGRRRFDYVYVIVEGQYFPDNHSGVMMKGHNVEHGFGANRHMFESFEKFLVTLELHGQIRLRRTNGKTATAYFIAALYRWFQKSWHSHKSAYKVEEDRPQTAIFDGRSAERKVYAQFPGIGWTRSYHAQNYFSCVEQAARASAQEWRHVTWKTRSGKKMSIGPKTSVALVAWLRGKDKDRKGKGR